VPGITGLAAHSHRRLEQHACCVQPVVLTALAVVVVAAAVAAVLP
jgi:hypothetical protein